MGRVLSIEIGMYSTRVCEASMGRTPKIYNCITFETPENAVEDGYIRDKSALELALRAELKKAKIRTRDVVYTVTSTKIANREVVIPPVKKDKIQKVIEANAQEYFPVDVGEYTISYSILEKIEKKEEKSWRIMALAVPDNLLKNYHSFSESMGFRVKNIDYMGNSVFQVFKRQKAGKVTLSLMINEQTTMIYVIDRGVLSLMRTIPYGTLTIAEEVMNRPAFGAETEREAVKKLETEEILFPKVGWQGQPEQSEQPEQPEQKEKIDNWNWDEPEPEETDTDAAAEAAATMTPEGAEIFAARRGVTDSVDYLIGNLIRVVDFYQTRNEGKAIDEILLAGQGAAIKGISDLISNETRLEVFKVQKPAGVTFTKSSLKEAKEHDSFVSCIGALVEPVKLQSKEQIAKKNRKDTLSGAKTILVLSAVLSAVLAGSSFFQLSQEKAEEKRLEETIASMASIQELYEESGRVEQEYNQYQEAYKLTETETEKLSELFLELEQSLPKTVVVDYISLDGEQVSLTLHSPNKLSTARLVMNLREIGFLDEITLPSVTKTSDESGTESWSYSITARFAAVVKAEQEAQGNEQAQDGAAEEQGSIDGKDEEAAEDENEEN